MTEDSRGPAPPPAPLRIFFDVAHHEYWFRRELENMIEVMGKTPGPDATLAESIETADCVLRVGGCPELRDKLSACFKRGKVKCPPEFVWDMSDLPTGGLRGFYASLPAYMYDRNRHRAFCLPVRCNEVIQPYALSDARFLYGFFGAVTSGVRARMLKILRETAKPEEGLLETRDSIWNQMWDRTGLKGKVDYADNLRQCRFNLVPRGSVLAGAGSRLYETMQAARVPVLISDWITLPAGVDWAGCSVQVKERDMARIPEILRGYSDRWEQMALNARRNWEEHFSQEAQLGELGRQMRKLLESNEEDKILSRLSGSARVALGLLAWKPRQYLLLARTFAARRRNAAKTN